MYLFTKQDARQTPQHFCLPNWDTKTEGSITRKKWEKYLKIVLKKDVMITKYKKTLNFGKENIAPGRATDSDEFLRLS